MAKATIDRNGTLVTVEGTPEEVQRVVELLSTSAPVRLPREVPPQDRSDSDFLMSVVAEIKTSADAAEIERFVLDRPGQLNRILLTLLVAERVQPGRGLTSGEVSTITRELGAPISQSNASTALAASSRLVLGDRVRRKGQAVRYRLTRRGIQLLESVLRGETFAE